MPAFIVLLLGTLGPILMSVAGRVLVGLGIAVVTFAGVDLALNALKVDVFSQLSGLPATILTVLYLTRVDQAINLIFSALVASVAIQGLQGAVKRFVHK